MLRKTPPSANDDGSPRGRTRSRWITICFAVVILTPSMIGFGMKFYEFMHTFQGDSQGAFAITPMVNYLLASLGFLFLLIWAAFNGAFKDMEAPKHLMLERDWMLDKHLKSSASDDHV